MPSGRMCGFVSPHDEALTIAKFLEVRDSDRLIYRPTVLFNYLPCDLSVASIHDLAMNDYAEMTQVFLNDDIQIGKDEVGALLLGHELGAWWVGSCLDIHGAREIIAGHNATTVQVAGGVLSPARLPG